MPTTSTGPGDGTGVTIHYEETHGINVSHREEVDRVLLDFLGR
jgi:hypothetical protein